MKITLTGSLGNIGSPLAKDLLAKGHAVTIISTDPKKESTIKALGAKAATANDKAKATVAEPKTDGLTCIVFT